MKNFTEVNTKSTEKKISRKEAIKKTGIVALTAASLLFLNTKAHACDSLGTGDQTGNRPHHDGNNHHGNNHHGNNHHRNNSRHSGRR